MRRRDADSDAAHEVASDLGTLELDLMRAQLAGDKALVLSLQSDRKDLLARLYDATVTTDR